MDSTHFWRRSRAQLNFHKVIAGFNRIGYETPLRVDKHSLQGARRRAGRTVCGATDNTIMPVTGSKNSTVRHSADMVSTSKVGSQYNDIAFIHIIRVKLGSVEK